MITTTHKQTISARNGVQTLQIEAGSQILAVQNQAGAITLWYECMPGLEMVNRTFLVIGTGFPLPEGDRRYIATVQTGELVWHVWEVVS